MEFFEDGKVVPDGAHTVTLDTGEVIRMEFKDFDHFKHSHMCEANETLWFVGQKRAGKGSLWFNTQHIVKIDMEYNSEEVAQVLEMERLATETEDSVIGVTPDGQTVYADELPHPQPIMMRFEELVQWLEAMQRGEGNGPLPGSD